MKLFLTLLITLFAFNVEALSFTERVSMQYSLHKEAMDNSKGAYDYSRVQDYTQLVQALLVVIFFMVGVIIFQLKKIRMLRVDE